MSRCLSVNIDHHAMPRSQNESNKSALGVMFPITHKNERADYLVEYLPVESKSNSATVRHVEETLLKYRIETETLKKNLVPIIGDCAIRGVLKVRVFIFISL